jgi:hypothetical protein
VEKAAGTTTPAKNAMTPSQTSTAAAGTSLIAPYHTGGAAASQPAAWRGRRWIAGAVDRRARGL